MNTFRFATTPLIQAACFCLLLLCVNAARAEFHGRDDLSSDSSNWEVYRMPEKKCRLIFRNSRLEYDWRSKRGGNSNHSRLRWTRNTGSFESDWFVQVDARYQPSKLSDSKRGAIGIAVVRTGTSKVGYLMTLDRNTSVDEFGGFRFSTITGKQAQYSLSSVTDSGLRIHYDSENRTLTGSWRTRSGWHTFRPVSLARWNPTQSDSFTVLLYGIRTNPHTEPITLAASRGTGAWLSNFRCGPSRPDITIDRPVKPRLRDGKSRLSFGTQPVNQSGRTQKLILRNDGTKTLRRLKITKGGRHARDFDVEKLPVSSLKPGEFIFFNVNFRPRDTGKRRANIKIHSNDKDERVFDIRLFGKGR